MRAADERFFYCTEINLFVTPIYTWHKAAILLSDLADNTPTETSAGPKKVGLLKKSNDLVHAFAAMCPHAGAPMCEGWLDATGRLVCPMHKYRFDPANGRNTSGEGYKLFIYPVEIRGNEIFIGLLN